MEEVLGKSDLVDCCYDRPSVFLMLHIADTLMTWKNKHNKPTAIHLRSHWSILADIKIHAHFHPLFLYSLATKDWSNETIHCE